MLNVEIISTSELGDRSYVAHDGRHALVIDPQRDIDRVEFLLESSFLELDLVLETHIHNDYVSGGFALATKTRARYGVAADADVAFARLELHGGDVLECGSLRVEVVATPGHTDNHLAFIVSDTEGSSALFSGGSLLYGSVGRTDLLGAELTERLTHSQYHSTRNLAEQLDDEVPLYPTHGFGSFCSSGAATGGDSSTIGIERRRNDVLLADDEEAFVQNLIANLTAYPSYYAHMGPLNQLGPEAAELGEIRRIDPVELGERIRSGEWVIDFRDADEFAIHHLHGTISIAVGESFSTYVGWLIPWESPITLVGESESALLSAQRQLSRIGIDDRVSASTGALRELAFNVEQESYPVVQFGDVPTDNSVTILDVRRADERKAGYIAGSIHLSLLDLGEKMSILPKTTLWVHCASGYRASIASSLLARAGFDVVLINDDYAAAAKTDLVFA